MPFGPAGHYNPPPDFGFATYRGYQGAPYATGTPEPWPSPGWGGPFPLAVDAEPVLMFLEMSSPFATPAAPAAAAAGAGALPELVSAIRLIPALATEQRESGESLKALVQRVESLQHQVEGLRARLESTPVASASRD